jgi:DNA (cytosine-5)-methyltransferase 1
VRAHLDLFSGIGGFALAANWAGFTTVGFVEYEDFPKRLLSKRFPGIPIHSDIHDFDATPFRGVDLVTGGFPCQPFSAAGKQRGKEDDRWLWKEMLRVIVEAQPTWVLAENVAGIVHMALDEVLADLEAQDYATGTVILPACSQNALHRRDRVWIVARDLADTTRQQLEKCEYVGRTPRAHVEPAGPSQSKPRPAMAHSKCESVRDKGSGQDASETSSSKGELRERQRIWSDPSECSTDVAHSEYKGSQRGVSGGQNPQWENQHGHTRCCSSSDIQPRENPSIVESRMGISIDGLSKGLDFPRRWGDGSWEDGIPRVTTQKENRAARLKALGNSILPQVAYEIIRHFD